MRFLILLIIILLLAFKLWPRQEPPTAEESFIGPQLKPLEDARKVEDDYMEALKRANEKIERESDGG